MFSELFKKNKIKEHPAMINEEYDYSGSMTERDKIFEKDLAALRLKYKTGQIPKINAAERQILEFCHDRDMIEFLREEFEKHPIVLDEDGGLVGGNPFERERQLKAALSLQTNNASQSDNSNYEIL